MKRATLKYLMNPSTLDIQNLRNLQHWSFKMINGVARSANGRHRLSYFRSSSKIWIKKSGRMFKKSSELIKKSGRMFKKSSELIKKSGRMFKKSSEFFDVPFRKKNTTKIPWKRCNLNSSVSISKIRDKRSEYFCKKVWKELH